jgi:MoaA/NifB/PqqE/SkfB family radical SAM enzyme
MTITGIERRVFRAVSTMYATAARTLYPAFSLPPLRISVLATTRCNLRCAFCVDKGKQNRPEPDRLSLDEWRQIIRTIPLFTTVDFIGSEPFLAANIFEILGALLEKKHIVWVSSNGTTLDEEQVRFLVDRGLTYLRCSIDGMTDYHNHIRGSNTAFQRVTETLRHIQECKKTVGRRRPVVGVKVNILPDNHDQIPDLLEFAEHELKVDQVYFNLMYDNDLLSSLEPAQDFDHAGFVDGNRYVYPEECRENVKGAVRSIFQYKTRSGIEIGFSQEMSEADTLAYIDNPGSFGVRHCSEPWCSFMLYYDGRVSPCIAYETGNIRELGYDVRRVVRDPRYREYLDFFKSRAPFFPPCGGCVTRHRRHP